MYSIIKKIIINKKIIDWIGIILIYIGATFLKHIKPVNNGFSLLDSNINKLYIEKYNLFLQLIKNKTEK